eukprot:CCRYP_018280-RC/>CCRYP_018280-RC protein AED:0.45 eAED:1.00 QI:0/0/0/1/0/0/2/0/158
MKECKGRIARNTHHIRKPCRLIFIIHRFHKQNDVKFSQCLHGPTQMGGIDLVVPRRGGVETRSVASVRTLRRSIDFIAEIKHSFVGDKMERAPFVDESGGITTMRLQTSVLSIISLTFGTIFGEVRRVIEMQSRSIHGMISSRTAVKEFRYDSFHGMS